MPILATPFGRSEPAPTLQSHVRGWPYRFFPLEFSLKNVPGYRKQRFAGGRFIVRQDQALQRDQTLLLRGGDRVEIWYELGEPLRRPVFLVQSAADDNDIEIRIGGVVERIEGAKAGELHRVELAGIEPDRTRTADGFTSLIYKAVVTSTRGSIEVSTQRNVARHCGVKVADQVFVTNYYVGLRFGLMGEAELFERDIYSLEWKSWQAPEEVPAGRNFHVATEVRNASAHPWFHLPGARLNLSYHWLDEDGETVAFDGLRTRFPRYVEAGEAMGRRILVAAPEAPGSYLLELDAVWEYVSWFSERNGGETVRIPIKVVAGADEPDLEEATDLYEDEDVDGLEAPEES